MLKRLDTLDVATTDLADAAATYARNFGFAVTRSSDGASARVTIGDAAIQLKSGAAVAGAIAAAGEGMVALWLEADDVTAVAAALTRAGFAAPAISIESGRRILAIDPALANQVQLFIFDRKG